MSAPLRPESWEQAVTGNRDAFETAVAPFLKDLQSAAVHLVELQRSTGGAAGTDLTPEELVGETLVRAFDLRDRFEETGMSFRAWLLGLQTRAHARYAQQEKRYTDSTSLSLDEVIPTGNDIDAVEEEWYEFRQPFGVTRWEDVIAGTAPYDLDVTKPTTFDERSLSVLAALDLPDHARHAVLLHDEYDLSIAEVSQILQASVDDTADHLNAARASLNAHLDSD